MEVRHSLHYGLLLLVIEGIKNLLSHKLKDKIPGYYSMLGVYTYFAVEQSNILGHMQLNKE